MAGCTLISFVISEESFTFSSHCVKSVQLRNFFWSVFFRIQAEQRDIWSKMRENTDQKKLRIRTLFKQCRRWALAVTNCLMMFLVLNKKLLISSHWRAMIHFLYIVFSAIVFFFHPNISVILTGNSLLWDRQLQKV